MEEHEHLSWEARVQAAKLEPMHIVDWPNEELLEEHEHLSWEARVQAAKLEPMHIVNRPKRQMLP